MAEPLFDLRAEVINDIRQDCDVGVWDNAFCHAEAGGAWVSDASETFAHGADWAARWIAGLMGMAEAIRRRAWCPHGSAYPGECLDCLDGGYDEDPVDESKLTKYRWVDGVGFVKSETDDRSLESERKER